MTSGSIKVISFAGSGNVASNLAPALFNAGFEIKTIFSRNIDNAAQLAAKVKAKPAITVDDIDTDTDLLILALPDSAIPGFALSLKNIANLNCIVAHTSGSQSLTAITQYFENGGVFYPLQSFTKLTIPDISGVPFCIEGASRETEMKLKEVALALSKDVRIINTAQRASIHLAAVFASNFTNFMYAVADCLLTKSGVDMNILYPLINETATRLKNGDPETLQTGPAVRRDWSTIDMHLNMLKNNPDLKELYKIISELIVKLKETGEAC